MTRCKRLKFDHTTKWYMHKHESILKNEMHKILWDYFETQIDYLIPARRPDNILLMKKKKIKKKKKNLPSSGFWHFGRPQSENKRKLKDRQIVGSCQRTKKAAEHESDTDTKRLEVVVGRDRRN